MKPISVKIKFHWKKQKILPPVFWVSLKLKIYGCVFNTSSGKQWYYKTLSATNSSDVSFII